MPLFVDDYLNKQVKYPFNYGTFVLTHGNLAAAKRVSQSIAQATLSRNSYNTVLRYSIDWNPNLKGILCKDAYLYAPWKEIQARLKQDLLNEIELSKQLREQLLFEYHPREVLVLIEGCENLKFVQYGRDSYEDVEVSTVVDLLRALRFSQLPSYNITLSAVLSYRAPKQAISGVLQTAAHLHLHVENSAEGFTLQTIKSCYSSAPAMQDDPNIPF